MEVKVTQADRIEAASLMNNAIAPDSVERVLSGNWDDHPFVQKFARHRVAALEEAALLADAELISPPDDDYQMGRTIAAEEIAGAIRLLKEKTQ